MPWYKAGTVTVTKGSSNVVGVGTTWGDGAIPGGAAFSLVDANGAAVGPHYEVLSVADDTHLTLKEKYGGATAAGVKYALWNLAGEQTTPYLSQQVSALVQRCKTVLSDVVTYMTRAETAATEAETAKDAAEAAQVNNEIAVAAQTGAEEARDAAVTAKNAAELAQTNAQAAQTAAETAKSGAESAKSGAQSAKSGAETARSGAEAARNDAMRYASLAGSNSSAGQNDQAFAEAILQQNLNVNRLYDINEGGN
ncbi:MAG: hypothetical protein Q4D58_08790 [Synergistaceae bacterium]|nr:hypothetical protein [Synergistaceae bacterium]